MIEKDGGSIEMESTPGEGTVFHCSLKPYEGDFPFYCGIGTLVYGLLLFGLLYRFERRVF